VCGYSVELTLGIVRVEIDRARKMMDRVIFCILIFDTLVLSLMVMDEESCKEVEENDCGICHTIYMEKFELKMVEELMPTKVSLCKNVTR
jgi:hypothetical protein